MQAGSRSEATQFRRALHISFRQLSIAGIALRSVRPAILSLQIRIQSDYRMNPENTMHSATIVARNNPHHVTTLVYQRSPRPSKMFIVRQLNVS